LLPTLDHADFQQAIGQGDVLVLFFARWCLPSRQLMVTLESTELGLAVYAVDIDVEPELHSECRVFCVPTLILFRDGREVSQKLGNLPERWLRWWLREVGCEGDGGGKKTGSLAAGTARSVYRP